MTAELHPSDVDLVDLVRDVLGDVDVEPFGFPGGAVVEWADLCSIVVHRDGDDGTIGVAIYADWSTDAAPLADAYVDTVEHARELLDWLTDLRAPADRTWPVWAASRLVESVETYSHPGLTLRVEGVLS